MADAFEKAAEDVKNLKQSPSNDELLELYALYKQATVGNVNTGRPGMLQVKDKAKWDAWNSKKDKSIEEAKKEYITYTTKLISTYGLK